MGSVSEQLFRSRQELRALLIDLFLFYLEFFCADVWLLQVINVSPNSETMRTTHNTEATVSY